MGEFTGDNSPPTTQPEIEIAQETSQNTEEVEKFETDVPDVKADGVVQRGTEKFPIFKVDQSEFYQNMEFGRKRLRFKSGSTAQQYMNKTRYNRPFFISYTDNKGKTYSRKIK